MPRNLLSAAFFFFALGSSLAIARPYPGLSNSDNLERQFSGIMHTEHHYLAISGGGADGAYGAYGAGVLAGWSELGTRPEFTMVTGISTGALIAEIARQYRRGRSLHIGTTNLDAGRPVIWNIGRIADSGHPDANRLIRQVLLASASIPGIFTPAYILVQGPDGRTYQEMHVDGGTSAQMFLYPSRTNWAELLTLLDVQGTPSAYLIRNSRFMPDYDPVRARVADIAAKSVTSLIRTQGIGDIYRIASITNRDGVDVELTWIPPTAPRDPGDEVFDPEYMSSLFNYGYQRSISGDTWTHIDINEMTTAKGQ